MKKNWDYAELAKMAKENGGPKKLIDKVKEGSRQSGYQEGFYKGRKQGFAEGGISVLIGTVLIWGVSKVRDWLTNKKSNEAIEEGRVAEEILLDELYAQDNYEKAEKEYLEMCQLEDEMNKEDETK